MWSFVVLTLAAVLLSDVTESTKRNPPIRKANSTIKNDTLRDCKRTLRRTGLLYETQRQENKELNENILNITSEIDLLVEKYLPISGKPEDHVEESSDRTEKPSTKSLSRWGAVTSTSLRKLHDVISAVEELKNTCEAREKKKQEKHEKEVAKLKFKLEQQNRTVASLINDVDRWMEKYPAQPAADEELRAANETKREMIEKVKNATEEIEEKAGKTGQSVFGEIMTLVFG